MKVVTVLKFGVFIFLLAMMPLIFACLFFALHEAHTSTYTGFFVGLVIDVFLFMLLTEKLFGKSIDYVHKKERETQNEG